MRHEKKRNDVNKRSPTRWPEHHPELADCHVANNNSLRWTILLVYDYGQMLANVSIKLFRRAFSLVNVYYSGKDNNDDVDVAAVTAIELIPCQPRYSIRDSTNTIIRLF